MRVSFGVNHDHLHQDRQSFGHLTLGNVLADRNLREDFISII